MHFWAWVDTITTHGEVDQSISDLGVLFERSILPT
jgi:hypothetical protein